MLSANVKDLTWDAIASEAASVVLSATTPDGVIPIDKHSLVCSSAVRCFLPSSFSVAHSV
jgi:hypothetical protein